MKNAKKAVKKTKKAVGGAGTRGRKPALAGKVFTMTNKGRKDYKTHEGSFTQQCFNSLKDGITFERYLAKFEDKKKSRAITLLNYLVGAGFWKASNPAGAAKKPKAAEAVAA